MKQLSKFFLMLFKYIRVFWKHSHAPNTVVIVYSTENENMAAEAKTLIRGIFRRLSKKYSKADINHLVE